MVDELSEFVLLPVITDIIHSFFHINSFSAVFEDKDITGCPNTINIYAESRKNHPADIYIIKGICYFNMQQCY